MNMLFFPAVLETFFGAYANVLLESTLKGSVLLASAILTVHLMKRCSAALRHFVLSFAVCSLLLLPSLSLALPRWKILPRWLSVAQVSSLRLTEPEFSPDHRKIDFTTMDSMQARTAVGSTDSNVLPQNSNLAASETSHEQTTTQKPLATWGIAIWLTGSLLALSPAVLGVLSLWRLERMSRVVESGPLLEILQRLLADVRSQRRVTFLIAANRRMPMTWGIFRPKILLPEEALSWPEERQRMVLQHELAHIRRCDYITNLIARFACALHWFNPLAWYAARRISDEQERACDDAVLSNGAKPGSYAEEILQLAAGPRISYFEPLGAVAMARPATLEGRLLAILDSSRNRTSLTAVRILLVGLLMACALVSISMVRAAQNVTGSASTSFIAATTAQSSGAESRPRGLIAWWRGEENTSDSAGNHDGTAPFGVRYTPGLIGNAFDFRRSYAIEHQLQRISIPDSPDFQLSEAMTLEAWIYPLQYDGIVLLRGDDRGGFDTWQLDLRNEGFLTYSFNTASEHGESVETPIQLHQWQHVAATFDHGAMKLYINGILMAHKQTGLRPIAVLDPSYDPALGIGNAGGKFYSMPFHGLIDEVRIYNRALSESEIIQRLKE